MLTFVVDSLSWYLDLHSGSQEGNAPKFQSEANKYNL